ncbi:hypothetical protein LRY65_04225 [Candidatus Woesebacteria bacterium]|nr:hypothetical protein [Candidatus Woesebacteria bacterium]MCD8507544.1 hypothetical protein [Candidatus Woesebacteria bacterium]MCD8527385.1 hypothetical protein [Candidatus Woesebacteria bacterium]MCD8546132.1 hypothetical protein [Candidatus Woesebacteria bacterium]
MKEIPQQFPPQGEEEKSINLVGKDVPADASYWGKVGRPDNFAIIYLWQDKVIYANGWTKKVYKVEQNDGSMQNR